MAISTHETMLVPPATPARPTMPGHLRSVRDTAGRTMRGTTRDTARNSTQETRGVAVRAANGVSGADTLKSVGTALDVLECFTSDEELGVSDIARRLGIAKSTAHRLLSTLCSRGIAAKNPETGMYQLGLHLYELGHLAQSRIRLRRIALPALEELSRQTGLTVQLSVMDGADLVILEQLQTASGRALLEGTPRRLPAHATSSGQVIAAFNPMAAQARRNLGFPPRAGGTVRSVAEYDASLYQIRRRGVAVLQDAAIDGISSVAAPIRDLNGRAYAAVCLVGATSDVQPIIERSSRLALVVARRISRAMATCSPGPTLCVTP